MDQGGGSIDQAKQCGGGGVGNNTSLAGENGGLQEAMPSNLRMANRERAAKDGMQATGFDGPSDRGVA